MNRFYIFKSIVLLMLTFSMHCGVITESGRDDSFLAWFLVIQASETSFQVKNKNDIGNIYIQYYEEPEITIGVGEIYPKRFYFSPIKSIGKYKLRSDLNGIIIDQNEFNFLGNLKDGILIRNDGSIRPGSCTLLDGLSGNVIVDGCI